MRGCHSSTEIESDETIVDIPLKCLITVEMGKETEVSYLMLIDLILHYVLFFFVRIDWSNYYGFRYQP